MNEDRFAEFLDQLSNGATPTDASPLASFTRRMQEEHSGDRLGDDRRASIRKAVLGAHEGGTPTTGGPGPLTQPALTAPTTFNPWPARRRGKKRPTPGRARLGIVNHGFQTGITALAIVAVVIAAFTAFPQLQPAGVPEVTPTAFAAAPTTDVVFGAVTPSPGTPDAEESEWLRYIQPEECSAEPLNTQETDAIIADPAVLSAREYTPLTTPDNEDAENAARAARDLFSCMGLEYMPLPHMTDRFIAGMSGPGSEFDLSYDMVARGQEVSDAYPDQEPDKFVRLSDEEPAEYTRGDWYGAPSFPVVVPSTAVQLADGRIGIPLTLQYWNDGPDAPTQEELDTLTYVAPPFVVLTKESGTWQVDEFMPFCVGYCDEFWTNTLPNGMRSPIATPNSTPSPLATPESPDFSTPLPTYRPPEATATTDL